METLPNELIPIIVNFIKLITDKRQFARTCKTYNVITKEIIKNVELNFVIPHLNYTSKYCVEKFTLELCHDKYFDLIPPLYFAKYNKSIVHGLSMFGDLKLLKIFIKNYYDTYKANYDFSSICNNAAIGGHLDILIWGRLNGCDWNNDALMYAAQYGHLHIIKYISKYIHKKDADICARAALNGHLNILIWAKEHGYRCNENVCRNASLGGHLEILIWAINNKCYLDESIIYYAAAIENNLNIIKWLHENNYEWDYKTCNGAAEKGHLELLKWLLKNGCGFVEDICVSAAASGNLDMLKWLKEIGCKLNQDVCVNAIIYRHLHILEWAVENGCELNERILNNAIVRGYNEITSWIKNRYIQNDIEFINKMKY